MLDKGSYQPKFAVYDTLGYRLGVFPTWKAAYTFKIANQRYDWVIKPLY